MLIVQKSEREVDQKGKRYKQQSSKILEQEDGKIGTREGSVLRYLWNIVNGSWQFRCLLVLKSMRTENDGL